MLRLVLATLACGLVLGSTAGADPFAAGERAAAKGRCAAKLVAGNWAFLMPDNAFCYVSVGKTGKIDRSACYTRDGRASGHMSGTLKVAKSCNVSGTVGHTATGLTYEVVGALDTGGAQIIGQARSVNGYFSYTGFKY